MKENHIKDEDRSFLKVENKLRESWNLDWNQVVNLHGKYILSSRAYISNLKMKIKNKISEKAKVG